MGADGIADHVQILAIRAVPDGDERDKDIANAVRYAADHDNKNIDSAAHFPNPNYGSGDRAGAYIVVGASSLKDNEQLKAPFSNYGKTEVDVFAPCLQIYSSIPGSQYDYYDGTSMAALIREYYPKLKAEEVKEIILKSVVKRASLTDTAPPAAWSTPIMPYN